LEIYQEIVGTVSGLQQLQNVTEVPHVSDGHLQLRFFDWGCHFDDLEKMLKCSR